MMIIQALVEENVTERNFYWLSSQRKGYRPTFLCLWRRLFKYISSVKNASNPTSTQMMCFSSWVCSIGIPSIAIPCTVLQLFQSLILSNFHQPFTGLSITNWASAGGTLLLHHSALSFTIWSQGRWGRPWRWRGMVGEDIGQKKGWTCRAQLC